MIQLKYINFNKKKLMNIDNLDCPCKNLKFNSKQILEDPYQMESKFEPSNQYMIYKADRIKF